MLSEVGFNKCGRMYCGMDINARPLRAATSSTLRGVGYPGNIGAVVAGSTSTVQLDPASLAINGCYVGAYVLVSSPAGDTQERVISAYAGDTRTATVSEPWDTPPDNTYTYRIAGLFGFIQDAGDQTLKLDASASTVNNTYAGATVYLAAGTGAGQFNYIRSYNGTTKLATVRAAWETLPAQDTVYAIFGESGATTTYNKTSITTTGLRHEGVNSAYSGLMFEVTECHKQRAAVAQVRTVLSFDGQVLTLDRPLDPMPVGEIRYHLHGGWLTPFIDMRDATYVLTYIAIPPTHAGCRRSISSLTPSGFNEDEVDVTYHEYTGLGQAGITGGVAQTAVAQIGQYYRLQLVSFSNNLTGGVQTRLSNTSQNVVSLLDSSVGGAPVGGAPVGGAGLPPLGQATAANSLPVVVASNQNAQPVLMRSGTGVAIGSTGSALNVNIASGTLAASYVPAPVALNLGTSGVLVKNDAGVLHNIAVSNTNPLFTRYLKIYNKPSLPDENDVPVCVLALFAQTSAVYQLNYTFNAGIGARATSFPAHNDTTAPDEGDIIAAFSYA